MFCGGLKPIRRRFALDVATLLALACSALLPTDDGGRGGVGDRDAAFFRECFNSHARIALLVLTVLATLVTAGATKRWTLSFPMVPVVLLQISRHLIAEPSASGTLVRISTLLLVGLSALLCALFPAVDIRSIEGAHGVGVADLHLPVEGFERASVSVRLWYPTREAGRMPYLNVATAARLCRAFMRVAPPPCHRLGFLLDQWQFATVAAARNAAPLVPPAGDESASAGDGAEEKKRDEGAPPPGEGTSKLPIVVFSHGVTGNAEVYTFQAASMAARGALVMSINHSDGSSIGFQQKDGSFLEFDRTISEVWKERPVEMVRMRRKQADYRTRELLAATAALLKLNDANIRELDAVGISLVGKLEPRECIVAGHSFGAATALTAAHRRPDWFTACISHDPAIDWCPDDSRRALLGGDRFEGSTLDYTGGTGGYEDDDGDAGAVAPSLHAADLFFLYSHQWQTAGWGAAGHVRDLHRRGRLGRAGGPTDVGAVDRAHHSEFSDSCMTLPLWLARATGVTGPRDPHATAEEIRTRTAAFVAEVRRGAARRRRRGGEATPAPARA